MATIHVDVVSAEASIFAGEAEFVALPGEAGELGILPGHIPLLTWLKPGIIHIRLDGGQEETIYVSGGMVEVMPQAVTVLADTAARTTGLDAERARQAEASAASHLREQLDEIHYAAARAELMLDWQRDIRGKK